MYVLVTYRDKENQMKNEGARVVTTYLNAKVSQLLLKCYFLLFEPKILRHDIMINIPMICRLNNMKIRPVRLTIGDLRQEM